MLFGDYQTQNREILLNEDLSWRRFQEPCIDKNSEIYNFMYFTITHGLSVPGNSLDIDHVLVAVEWLAKFHGLSYVMLHKYKGGPKAWVEQNPWIRNQDEDVRLRNGTSIIEQGKLPPIMKTHQKIYIYSEYNHGYRSKLISMATAAIKMEIQGQNEKIESLLERQTWLDDLRRVKVLNCFL